MNVKKFKFAITSENLLRTSEFILSKKDITWRFSILLVAPNSYTKLCNFQSAPNNNTGFAFCIYSDKGFSGSKNASKSF